MKKILPFIFALMAVSAIFCACDETKTYAEKMEEEDNADTMVSCYKLFGQDPRGLYLLDQEYAARVYTAPSLVL